jgi:putative transcriptional regulator
MGERKLRIADVARETGLNRSVITALWTERIVRLELATLDILCQYFSCSVGDILEWSPDLPLKKTAEDQKYAIDPKSPVWHIQK